MEAVRFVRNTRDRGDQKHAAAYVRLACIHATDGRERAHGGIGQLDLKDDDVGAYVLRKSIRTLYLPDAPTPRTRTAG